MKSKKEYMYREYEALMYIATVGEKRKTLFKA